MNFKELMRVQEHTEQSAVKRHQQAATACAQGIALIKQAFEQNFSDKTVLREAHRRFIKALAFHRQNVAPYLGIAYLQLLLNDKKTAILYLQEALSYEPEHEEVLALLAYISQAPTAAEGQALPSESLTLAFAPVEADAEAAEDLDELYEMIQGFIQQQLRWVTQELGPSEPTLEPEAYQALQAQYQALQEASSYIHSQLQKLEAELDTAALQQQLRPLEISLKRFEKAVKLSAELVALSEAIQEQLQLTDRLREQVSQRQLAAELAQHEQQLEHLMDHCDQLADQLDAIDEQGVKAEPLIKQYEKLVLKIENIQELLDETQPAAA